MNAIGDNVILKLQELSWNMNWMNWLCI